jgi:predicted phosphodiesterase
MTKRRMRLSLALASLALVLTAAAFSTSDRWNFDFAQYKGEPRPQAEDEFRFVIVGDRTGGAQWGIMPQVFREINLLDPDFVISVGDIIDGGGDEETVNGIWDEFDTTELPVLKVPFVYMPGNHDIYSPASKRVYERRYGPRFKSFNYRGLHFICLNTQEAAGNRDNDRNDDRFRGPGGSRSLGDEQLAWLKDDIERNRNARRILIFMHQPTWSLLDPVYPLLEGLKVNVFAGHYHKYSYSERNGIPHIICSATAAYIPEEGKEAYGRFRSYLMATVRDDDLKLALIKLGGVYSPKYIMEQDQSGVRALTDSCAILRDGDAPDARTQVVFRNPMSFPVRLQIVRSTRGSTKHLFDGNEPTVGPGEALRKDVDWPGFAGSGAVPSEFRVAYRFQNSGGVSESFDYPIEARVHRVTQARAVPTPPTIDGDLSDWTGAAWQPIADRTQASAGLEAWQGPQDLSAQFAVAGDGTNIYLAVRVTDENIGYNNRAAESDSIEIFTADADGREITYSRETNDFRHLIVTPFSGDGDEGRGATAGETRLRQHTQRNIWGSPPPSQEFPDAKAAYTRGEKHYVIEVAIPRKALAWDDLHDTINQLDIAINDRDSNGNRETQLTWSGNESNMDSSRYYGEVRLPTP